MNIKETAIVQFGHPVDPGYRMMNLMIVGKTTVTGRLDKYLVYDGRIFYAARVLTQHDDATNIAPGIDLFAYMSAGNKTIDDAIEYLGFNRYEVANDFYKSYVPPTGQTPVFVAKGIRVSKNTYTLDMDHNAVCTLQGLLILLGNLVQYDAVKPFAQLAEHERLLSKEIIAGIDQARQ